MSKINRVSASLARVRWGAFTYCVADNTVLSHVASYSSEVTCLEELYCLTSNIVELLLH